MRREAPSNFWGSDEYWTGDVHEVVLGWVIKFERLERKFGSKFSKDVTDAIVLPSIMEQDFKPFSSERSFTATTSSASAMVLVVINSALNPSIFGELINFPS